MIETHDYVDINFLGTPRYKKPVGIYWLQSFAVRLLNPHHLDEIWAYRVPSLLGATLAVLMTAATGALLFNGMTGLIAAVMLASCLDLDIEAHLAKTDAALLASIMVAQYALARAYLLPRAGWANAFAFWSAIGIGILLKGPIILLPLFSVLLWMRMKEKNLSWFARLKPSVGLLYLAALVTPWFIAINLASHGQFAAQSAGQDMLAKIWQGQDRGFMPPGLHLLIFPAMFFPFSLLALLAAPDAWRRRNEKPMCFCIGWIVPTWIVFELSLTKLPHYVLPAYPAIAIAAAAVLPDGFPALTALAKAESWKRWLPTALVAVWLLVGVALAAGLAVAPYITAHETGIVPFATGAALLSAQGAALLFLLQGKKLAGVSALTLGALVFSVTVFLTLPKLEGVWLSRDIVRQARAIAPCEKLAIVSAGYQEPSLAFLAGSNTKLVPNGTYAASEMQHDPCRVGVIRKNTLNAFLTSSSDFTMQPYPAGTIIRGIDADRAQGNEIFFYLMPQTHAAVPAYP